MPIKTPKKISYKERKAMASKINREAPRGFKMASALKSLNTDERKFYCCSCSRSFEKQRGNFYSSTSVFYRGNNGYLPICIRCTEFYMVEYERILGSREAALRRMAMHWDFYIGEKIMESVAKSIKTEDSPLKILAHRNSLNQWGGMTYDSYLEEIEAPGFVETEDDIDRIREDGKIKITQRMLERWGLGLKETDYPALESHYQMLKKYNPNCDSNQEMFIMDLCFIKVQQMEAFKNEDHDSFPRLTKSYRDTFKQAGLKTVEEGDGSGDDPLGVTLAVISQYTPEEYYKDKELYKDFDGLGSYIERFLLRPMKNLLTGTTDRDPEYSVSGESE